MNRFHNFWVYSVGLVVAWAVVFAAVGVLRGEATVREVLLVFAGFCIAWVSTTIARYVYPPPAKWTSGRRTS